MVKYVSGVGYRMKKSEYDSIYIEDDGTYVIPLAFKAYKFKKSDIKSIVKLLIGGETKAGIARKYNTTVYRLNTFLNKHSVDIISKVRCKIDGNGLESDSDEDESSDIAELAENNLKIDE